MFHRSTFFCLALLVVIAALLSNEAEGRYLPTRAAGFDKLDKLKELLREVSKVQQFLESEIDKEEGDSQPRWHPESKLFYKREIPSQ